MKNFAEIFPPGEFLKDELESRGWTQTEMAEIMGRPTRLINEIIAGKKTITPETAIQLGDCLGTGPEVWLNLESQYQLSKIKATDGVISRRAKLYELFPVREMIRRGWIVASKNIDVLESQFLTFFNIKESDDEIIFCHSAKKTNAQSDATVIQKAWLFRAKKIASEMVTPKYSEIKLRNSLQTLSGLLSAPEEVRHVPRILHECGVRFIVIEPIPGTKIDGACFWLNEKNPVVVLSLRLDRIDNFWFVLRHEIEHVLCNHGREGGFLLDTDIDGAVNNPVDEEERQANISAAEFCVNSEEFNSFYMRLYPFFSETRVLQFSSRINIHPGIVVGQLQKRLGRYDMFRKHQVKVRNLLTPSAYTDGWGVVSSIKE